MGCRNFIAIISSKSTLAKLRAMWKEYKGTFDTIKSCDQFFKEYFKVFQYNQWDGQPDGQGLDIYNFFKNLATLDEFKSYVDKIQILSKKDVYQLEKESNPFRFNRGCDNNQFSINYPHLTVLCGAQILNIINDKKGDMSVQLYDGNFACDYIFCEYGYIIDLSDNTLHCLMPSDQNTAEDEILFPLTKFGHRPLKLIKKFDITNLPESEEKFLIEINDAVELHNGIYEEDKEEDDEV